MVWFFWMSSIKIAAERHKRLSWHQVSHCLRELEAVIKIAAERHKRLSWHQVSPCLRELKAEVKTRTEWHWQERAKDSRAQLPGNQTKPHKNVGAAPICNQSHSICVNYCYFKLVHLFKFDAPRSSFFSFFLSFLETRKCGLIFIASSTYLTRIASPVPILPIIQIVNVRAASTSVNNKNQPGA